MKREFYAVKDELAGVFMMPNLFNSKAEAERQFKTTMNNVDLWRDNAADYSLYKIGEYDDATGELTSTIEKIGTGHSYLR